MILSEKQFEALKDWVEEVARRAVVEARPAHDRLAGLSYPSYEESWAKMQLTSEEWSQ